jgi:hypothetical protein
VPYNAGVFILRKRDPFGIRFHEKAFFTYNNPLSTRPFLRLKILNKAQRAPKYHQVYHIYVLYNAGVFIFQIYDPFGVT